MVFEELFQPGDLAFAKARRTGDFAGEMAVDRFGVGGDQMGDAEFARDRRGDEAVGGGDDGDQVGFVEVLPDQIARGLGDHRLDPCLHVFGMPGVELRAGVGGQRAQRKCEEGVNIQPPGLVIIVKSLVFGFVMRAIDHAFGDEELPPLVVGVAGQQGVVEIEQDEVHFWVRGKR